MEQDEVQKLQLRLDALKNVANNNDDDNEKIGSGGSGGRGGDDGTPGPGPPPPRTPKQEMEDIVRRLDIFRGNTPDFSPANTPAQNSRIITQQNEERFQNGQIREREISNISKGIVNKRKSSINFIFPDTPKHLLEVQKEEHSMTTRIFLLRHIFLNQLALVKQVFYF